MYHVRRPEQIQLVERHWSSGKVKLTLTSNLFGLFLDRHFFLISQYYSLITANYRILQKLSALSFRKMPKVFSFRRKFLDLGRKWNFLHRKFSDCRKFMIKHRKFLETTGGLIYLPLLALKVWQKIQHAASKFTVNGKNLYLLLFCWKFSNRG